MSDRASGFLFDPVLIFIGVRHGFGERGGQPPDSTAFPVQVHGTDCFEANSKAGNTVGAKADVIWTRRPGQSVGIVTADCVPILVATRSGRAVAAIHAGWRGLSAGVIECGLEALRAASGEAELAAAVGPAARACCYEVDAPVHNALMQRYSRLPEDFLTPGRPDRFQLDLPTLAEQILIDCGVEKHQIGLSNACCTICTGTRFESFRRDGPRAGRLKHFISPGDTNSLPQAKRVDSE